MKLEVLSLEKEKVGEVDVSDSIFARPVRQDILARVVRYQLAKRRRGTRATKTRAEVKYTGKKWYRQKGTGGARHGDRGSPIFVGGGRTFGVRPKNYTQGLQKKVRALGLKMALSSQVRHEKFVVLDVWPKEDKTKAFVQCMNKLGLANALCVVCGEEGEPLYRVAANVEGVDILPVEGLNVYDILRHTHVVVTKDSLEAVEARLK